MEDDSNTIPSAAVPKFQTAEAALGQLALRLLNRRAVKTAADKTRRELSDVARRPAIGPRVVLAFIGIGHEIWGWAPRDNEPSRSRVALAFGTCGQEL